MEKLSISLEKKYTMLLLVMAVTLSSIVILFGYQLYKRSMERHFIVLGNNLAKTAANFVDGDKIDYYLDTRTPDEDYNKTLELKRENDVLYLYVVRPTPKGTYYVYDTDESEDRCELGDFEEWYSTFFDSSQKFIAGEDIAPLISNESFGWLLSVYQQIYGSDGTVKGYVGADFSMQRVVRDRQMFLFQLVTATFLTTLFFALLYLRAFRTMIILPIDKMVRAVDEFLIGQPPEQQGLQQSSISALEIKTGDELERLSDSLKSMERKIDEYIHNLDVATKRAETDSLTGLINRDAFQKSVDAYLFYDTADDQIGAFMMIDIDYFKQINDTCGHIVGDEVLKKCAKTLKTVFRSSDLVSRLGGDEFAVFCRDVGRIQTIIDKAEAIREQWKNIRFDGLPRTITASMGIALAPRDGESYLELYQKADISLYQAKEAGRDRYIFYRD